MEIKIRKSAIKDLKRISPDHKKKIHAKIISLKDFPDVIKNSPISNLLTVCALAIIEYYLM